jgi:hypothetical protein
MAMADLWDYDLRCDEPDPAACGVLEHSQILHRPPHRVGAGFCVMENLQVVAVPDAQAASVRSHGDPGAAIRGPLVGDEATDTTVVRAVHSPQEGAGSGVPHAQIHVRPYIGHQAGRVPTGRGKRPDPA